MVAKQLSTPNPDGTDMFVKSGINGSINGLKPCSDNNMLW